ncbi:MAG TPA: pyridoxamine 5'-phosphate oxidase family protein [Actinomycetota bacterium]|nr:pyridoxamine 5'-phosphate oxidase family protein [Actinomycetota bacterium]
MSFLSTAVQHVLQEGPFCAVAASTPRGPHCTPLVFAYSGGRVWLTTSRGSVKTRAWKADPTVAGLVRLGELAVSFTGTVKTYDALDRNTWGAAVAGATSIARATARFSKKNARFFAGYAFDAHQVPLAWTPPGRVFVGIDLERTALLDDDGVQEGRGRWGGEAEGHATFRRLNTGADPLAPLPPDVAATLGRSGDGVLTVAGGRAPVVVPVRWVAEASALYAALPAETLALADAGPDAPVALTVDEASPWRAREMAGAMVQGTAACYVLDELGSGAKTARTIATGLHPGAGALVRITPERLVWWKGWTSGSAAAA